MAMVFDSSLPKRFKRKNLAYRYGRFLSADNIEDRKRMILRDWLYTLIEKVKIHIPSNATYDVVGLDNRTIHHARLIYFLFPRRLTSEAEYRIVFDDKFKPDHDGYKLLDSLDNSYYILKKD